MTDGTDTRFRAITIGTWERRELFRFYAGFANPNYNVSVSLDAREIFRFAKERGESFFLLACFAVAKALNAVPAMHLRFLDDERVAEDAVVHPSCQLAREGSELFVQALLPYRPTFAEFRASAAPIVESVRRGNAPAETGDGLPNIFCASCVPWFSATGTSAADFAFNQAEQILTWFKMTPAGEITLSGRFNHCFTDGVHLGAFFNGVAANFARPETL